jgi:hypothetical protein
MQGGEGAKDRNEKVTKQSVSHMHETTSWRRAREKIRGVKAKGTTHKRCALLVNALPRQSGVAILMTATHGC